MVEIPHSVLERFHYKALENPLYALDGMADVLREDLMMQMGGLSVEETRVAPDHQSGVQFLQPEWTPKQWDKVQQLEAEIRGWRMKHSILQRKVDLLEAKVDHGSKRTTYTISI